MRDNRFLEFFLIFNAIILVLVIFDFYQNGKLIYALDDAYIHLAMAKNIASHNIWGVTPYEVAFASSSPLYTLLLSLFIVIFGNHDIYPFIINILSANLLLYILFKNLKKYFPAFVFTFIMLIIPLFIFLQVLSGMEHVLHCLLVACVLLSYLKLGVDSKLKDYITLGLLLIIAVSIRYETLFIVVALFAVSLLKKDIKTAFVTFVSCLVPLLGFSCYFYQYSGHFFPNSILLKKKSELTSEAAGNLILNFLDTFNVFGNLFFLFNILFFAISIICWKRLAVKNFQSFIKNFQLYFIAIAVVTMHLTFSAIGWLYRYEAYVLLIFVIGIAVNMEHVKDFVARKKVIRIAIPIFIVFCLMNAKFTILRTLSALRYSALATKNINDQHITISKFLKKYYDTSKVAVNDIGAISYFTDIRLMDLTGLGSQKIMEKRLAKVWNDKTFNDAIHKNDLMIIYDEWFNHYSFDAVKVAEMKISYKTIVGSDTVSFYAFNESDAIKLKNNLKDFEKTLPSDIFLKYFNLGEK